ncbi:hypothetical protein ACFL5C_03330, partial [Candidatus Omnitrophota bacterium]
RRHLVEALSPDAFRKSLYAVSPYDHPQKKDFADTVNVVIAQEYPFLNLEADENFRNFKQVRDEYIKRVSPTLENFEKIHTLDKQDHDTKIAIFNYFHNEAQRYLAREDYEEALKALGAADMVVPGGASLFAAAIKERRSLDTIDTLLRTRNEALKDKIAMPFMRLEKIIRAEFPIELGILYEELAQIKKGINETRDAMEAFNKVVQEGKIKKVTRTGDDGVLGNFIDLENSLTEGVALDEESHGILKAIWEKEHFLMTQVLDLQEATVSGIFSRAKVTPDIASIWPNIFSSYSEYRDGLKDLPGNLELKAVEKMEEFNKISTGFNSRLQRLGEVEGAKDVRAEVKFEKETRYTRLRGALVLSMIMIPWMMTGAIVYKLLMSAYGVANAASMLLWAFTWTGIQISFLQASQFVWMFTALVVPLLFTSILFTDNFVRRRADSLLRNLLVQLTRIFEGLPELVQTIINPHTLPQQKWVDYLDENGNLVPGIGRRFLESGQTEVFARIASNKKSIDEIDKILSAINETRKAYLDLKEINNTSPHAYLARIEPVRQKFYELYFGLKERIPELRTSFLENIPEEWLAEGSLVPDGDAEPLKYTIEDLLLTMTKAEISGDELVELADLVGTKIRGPDGAWEKVWDEAAIRASNELDRVRDSKGSIPQDVWEEAHSKAESEYAYSWEMAVKSRELGADDLLKEIITRIKDFNNAEDKDKERIALAAALDEIKDLSPFLYKLSPAELERFSELSNKLRMSYPGRELDAAKALYEVRNPKKKAEAKPLKIAKNIIANLRSRSQREYEKKVYELEGLLQGGSDLSAEGSKRIVELYGELVRGPQERVPEFLYKRIMELTKTISIMLPEELELVKTAISELPEEKREKVLALFREAGKAHRRDQKALDEALEDVKRYAENPESEPFYKFGIRWFGKPILTKLRQAARDQRDSLVYRYEVEKYGSQTDENIVKLLGIAPVYGEKAK